MYLEKKRRFFPYKSHPMLVRQEKIPSSVLRPSLLSTAVYVVQYLIFTGIYLVGMLWGIYRVVQANDGLGMHSETKILLQFLVGLVLLLFRFHMEEKRSFFLKVQFSTRIILHLDKPLSNNWTMPLSDA